MKDIQQIAPSPDLDERVDEMEGKDEIKPFDFGSRYTNNIPGILKGLNISLAVTSYQSQALFLIRSDGETIDTNIKRFRRPMGLVVNDEQITLGTHTEIVKFGRNDSVIQGLEDSKKVDGCFTPTASHTTGMINIHDIAYGNDGLWIVNSAFSCLATIEPDYSFVPRWTPPFITELKPEDRCHLNGMGMKNGRPKYVTTFDQEDQAKAWLGDRKLNGTLIDVETNEILLENLSMPHSPRWYQGYVYFCNSGYGLVNRFDPEVKELKQIAKVQGFTRGMDFWGPLMFVGLSKTRKSKMKNKPPIADEYDETYCGIWIINLDDNSIIGEICFEGDVTQIYDIAVLPDVTYPELIEPLDKKVKNIFSFPSFSPGD